jgi:hypothetical protein
MAHDSADRASRESAGYRVVPASIYKGRPLRLVETVQARRAPLRRPQPERLPVIDELTTKSAAAAAPSAQADLWPSNINKPLATIATPAAARRHDSESTANLIRPFPIVPIGHALSIS